MFILWKMMVIRYAARINFVENNRMTHWVEFGVRQSVGGLNHGFLGPGGFDQKSPKTKASQNEIPTLPSDPITSVTPVPPSLSLSHTHTHIPRNRTKTQSHTSHPKKLPVVFSQNSLFFYFRFKVVLLRFLFLNGWKGGFWGGPTWGSRRD